MNPQSPDDRCRDPFEDALNAVLNGEADARDVTILNETLRIDPEARRTYIRAMAFEGLLGTEFAPLADHGAGKERVRWWLPASIAAAVLLGAFLAWKLPMPSGDAVAGNPDSDDDAVEFSHAVVSCEDGAAGRFGGAPLTTGLRLAEGMVELDRGRAEITFDSGAEVTLEGPARLLLESESKSRLDAGRASAYVPEEARGFVIHTPTSYIRDLGTAFAVEVRDDKETDLHVLEGEVEVSPTGRSAARPPKILRQKEAVRLARGGMQPINFRADGPWERPLKRPAKIPDFVHWSFDEWNGNVTTDSTRGHLLEVRRKQKPGTPELVEGPFGSALHLDGEGAFASSDYPGVGGSQPRTIACWVRVNPSAPDRPGFPNGIMSWGVSRLSAKWQIAWNRNSAQGNVGAVRVEFGDGSVVASTDLRDGRWHHLAVVYLGGTKANVATHVRIYLDGRLEPFTGRRNQKVNTDTTSAGAQPLTLGRFLGGGKNRNTIFFEGDLDEVHVFEGPLLPRQIVRLMKRNTLRPAEK